MATKGNASSRSLDCFATCAKGLEDVLAHELRSEPIKAKHVKEGSSGVWFRADWPTVYRANLWLRSAIRVLVKQSTRTIRDSEQLLSWARGLPWEELVNKSTTISVDCRVWDSTITHSKYAALRIKDGLCDHMRDLYGWRPDVQVDGASLPLSLYIFKNEATLYRDSSGMTLHKRGYRNAMHKSSLNESLAAGMLLMAGYKGEGDLVDPMCGSGTLLIEAALIALKRAPGLLRKRRFPFESWPEFDQEAYTDIRNEARDLALKELPARIIGYDRHAGALSLAQKDVSHASLDRHITLETGDAESIDLPFAPAWVVSNPPWGEHLEAEDVEESWRRLGRFLKREAGGCKAFLLSGNPELTKFLGMRATRRHPLRIGRIDTRVLHYDVHKREARSESTHPRQLAEANEGVAAEPPPPEQEAQPPEGSPLGSQEAPPGEPS